MGDEYLRGGFAIFSQGGTHVKSKMKYEDIIISQITLDRIKEKVLKPSDNDG